MGAKIIDRGRGPEIEGTRITVYDVMDYLQEGWRYDQIAGLFRLPPDDIQAAIQYIEAHKEAVIIDERFNGTLRDECLNMETFHGRDHARAVIKL